MNSTAADVMVTELRMTIFLDWVTLVATIVLLSVLACYAIRTWKEFRHLRSGTLRPLVRQTTVVAKNAGATACSIISSFKRLTVIGTSTFQTMSERTQTTVDLFSSTIPEVRKTAEQVHVVTQGAQDAAQKAEMAINAFYIARGIGSVAKAVRSAKQAIHSRPDRSI